MKREFNNPGPIIYNWKEIAGKFRKSDLLLGNGFSLNLSSKFSYNSLFDKFLAYCSPKERKIFKDFHSSNFELIQKELTAAKKVNEIFRIPVGEIEKARDKLRKGLIETIKENHPRASEIDFEKLKRISETLDQFGNIYTVNYDLFLYYVILQSRDRHKQNSAVRPYQDYFWSKYNDMLLEFMDHQGYSHYKHVYYLHGALFLFSGSEIGHYRDVKLRCKKTDALIELITRIMEDGLVPLFVCEGEPDDKFRAISNSSYLRFAYSKLERLEGHKLVIYGSSLSQQDRHIVEALNKRGYRIAISIRAGDKTHSEINREIQKFRDKLNLTDLVFFDSKTLFFNEE